MVTAYSVVSPHSSSFVKHFCCLFFFIA